MSLLPSWFWIAVVVFAALSQTVRNTAQRSLSGGNAGALGATLARFLYGIPLALVYVAALQMLSGGSTPRESMPEFVQTVMLAAPTTHFVKMAQAILYRGAGFDVVWPQFLAIIAIGAIFFAIALARFRRTIGTMA